MEELNPRYKLKASLALLATRIQDILWFNSDSDELDPDKEWDAGTVELIADQMGAFGLRPRVAEPSTLVTPEWFEKAQARHPEETWRREVANNGTRLGYEDWVISQEQD